MILIDGILKCFIPIFVAVGVFSVTPLFLSLTEGIAERERKRLITQATFAALIIAVGFIFLGKFIFEFLGITSDDFKVGGGLVLLVLSIHDLLFASAEERRAPSREIGVVPIGIPLIIGPATLTTLIILVDQYGISPTLIALVLNLAIVWFVFRFSDAIVKVIGEGGSKAMAKVSSLLLTAIAVMMIRSGIYAFFHS